MRELLHKYVELDLDAVFGKFVDTMLSNRDFSNFFRDEEQIKSLVVRQKQFILSLIEVPDDELKERYVKLGELHYDIKLPYVDFMVGVNILQEGFTHAIVECGQPIELLDETSQFFRLIRTFTARGYLNRMLEADIRDIDLYLSQVQRAADIDISLSTERMIWLKNIIIAIKMEDRAAVPAPGIPSDILDAIKAATHGDQILMNYVMGIVSRMEVDARNIFYFLDQRSYEEVLPLYGELMSIYKLCLMLINVVTIATTNLLVQALSKDALTGMLTRHALRPIFHRELTFAAAGQYEISFIMADIDHFKKVNDTYGHAAGDIVLKQVAHVVAETIRATDFGFRMGGEEFLLVLKGASLKVALAQAELMRQAIEDVEFDFDGTKCRVTASFGVATFAAPFEVDYEKMIKIADAKLYEAKRNGRNRISS